MDYTTFYAFPGIDMQRTAILLFDIYRLHRLDGRQALNGFQDIPSDLLRFQPMLRAGSANNAAR